MLYEEKEPILPHNNFSASSIEAFIEPIAMWFGCPIQPSSANILETHKLNMIDKKVEKASESVTKKQQIKREILKPVPNVSIVIIFFS